MQYRRKLITAKISRSTVEGVGTISGLDWTHSEFHKMPFSSVGQKLNMLHSLMHLLKSLTSLYSVEVKGHVHI